MPLMKRVAHIQNEWEKFIKGEPIDSTIVPKKIVESWKRSRSYGVWSFERGYRHYLTNEKITEYVKSMLKRYSYWVQLFDSSGKALTDPVETSPAMEQIIGTNAVHFALVNNRPSMVLSYEHYHPALHKYNSAAAPIHDCSGRVIGAVNVMCFSQQIRSLMAILPMATFIARLIDNAISLADDNELRLDLKSLMNCMPQGIAFFENEEMIFHNDKIIELLKINNASDVSAVLEEKLSHLAKGTGVSKKQISMYVDGQKSDLLVTALDVPRLDGKEIRVLQLEEAKSEPYSVLNFSDRCLTTFDEIVGESKELLEAKKLAQKLASSSAPVLIYGESGTGKEMFAQAIHQASPRQNKPFVTINCGAIPKELVESELFGYEPGAFTGALKKGKKGLLELGSGGTVFLDEIESMPLYMQVKLLRALSEGKIMKVGGYKETPIDIRVISASKKDLFEEVKKETFREDLYYRISTFTIKLPPLRERNGDITLLARHFITRFKNLYGKNELYGGEDFFEALENYSWPGNVREMKNVIERVVFLAEKPELSADDLPEYIKKAYNCRHVEKQVSQNKILSDYSGELLKVGEEIIIESVLRKTKFNIKRSCEILGISEKTLYNKINKSPKLKRLKSEETCSKNK